MSQVGISGVDPERPRVDPSMSSDKGSWRPTFEAAMGESVPQRMFPSDNDLLKVDLQIFESDLIYSML